MRVPSYFHSFIMSHGAPTDFLCFPWCLLQIFYVGVHSFPSALISHVFQSFPCGLSMCIHNVCHVFTIFHGAPIDFHVFHDAPTDFLCFFVVFPKAPTDFSIF
jgi:hypothetical protein